MKMKSRRNRKVEWPKKPQSSKFKSTDEFREILEIGEGGYSRVYKAQHIPTCNFYAIKEVNHS